MVRLACLLDDDGCCGSSFDKVRDRSVDGLSLGVERLLCAVPSKTVVVWLDRVVADVLCCGCSFDKVRDRSVDGLSLVASRLLRAVQSETVEGETLRSVEGGGGGDGV